MKLPQVGAGINCRLLGAADYHALQEPNAGASSHCRSLLSKLSKTRKERTPVSPIICFQCPQLTKLHIVQAGKGKKYLKGLSPFLPNRQWDINLQLRDGQLIPGIRGNLYLAEISEDHLVQSPIF